jgi:hypothetical protein
LVILLDQGIEIVAIEKKVMVGRTARSAYWLNHDPSGLVEAGYGSDDEVTHYMPSVTRYSVWCDGVTVLRDECGTRCAASAAEAEGAAGVTVIVSEQDIDYLLGLPFE